MSDEPDQPESTPPVVQRQSDDEALLTQAELDTIVRRMPSAAVKLSTVQPAPPAPEAEVDLADADTLEALFSGDLSLDEFDMPDMGHSGFDPAVGLLTQEELDAVLAQQSAPRSKPAAKVSRQSVADELIEEVLDAEAAKPESAPPSETNTLSQSELDALISQAAAASGESPSAKVVDSLELDNIIGGMTDDDVLSADELAALDDMPAVVHDAEEVLDGSRLDEPLGGEIEETVSLAQDNVESLLADLDIGGAPAPVEEPVAAAPAQESPAAVPAAPAPPPPLAPEPEPQGGVDEVSQDMIDALLSAAESSETQGDISSENLAAAATAPVTPTESEETPRAPEPIAASGAPLDEAALSAAAEAVAEAAPAKTPRKRKAKTGGAKLPVARLAASLLAGLLGASLTFGLLWVNQEKRPTFADLGGQPLLDLREALVRAREFQQEGLYGPIIDQLEGPLEEAPESDERAEAEFLMLEARFHLLNAPFGSPKYQELHDDISAAVERYPAHERAPEALYWEARLYQQEQLPSAAIDVLESIIEHYPTMRGLDGVLLEDSELALEVNRPQLAAERLQQLLFEFPGSPYAGEGKLLLGDSYLKAGMVDDARTLYVRVAENDPDPQSRAEGILRLGRMAFDAGDYARAADELQTFLERTTTFEGNDAVYLELARAQRRMGDLEAARSNLSDIINFFPQSETTPKAFVELVEVTDALGERGDALRLAQQAAVRFPENPGVLRAKGEMLGLTGNPYAAAEALLAAEDAGAFDPELLLTAARHFKTAGLTDRALEAYARLRRSYPDIPAANIGAVEAARIRYDEGDVREAIKSLDELALATSNSDQHLPVLLAQSDIYKALGWGDALSMVSREIATSADDDETLAQAAIALLEAGEVQEGRLIVDRVDPARLRESTAYAMLRELGRQLLPQVPREGLDYLEQAYMAYPDQRTRADDLELLRAYLAADRPAAARRVVMELASEVQTQPIDSIHLLEASIAWGDYLYERGDYRTAADAYAMAVTAADKMTVPPTEPGRDPRWAKYQRANALLQLRDYDNGLRLLDEVAASTAPWAGEARTKADYARLERRLQSARSSAEG
ncbi:MAG: tetratricopeptide repeat protein [Candidatus Hydrogenedens sp.]|nr:tetratricopeptide repeat protein [Candidatus Hydrogenedens sp.]